MKALLLVLAIVVVAGVLAACSAAAPPDPLLNWDKSGSSNGSSGSSGSSSSGASGSSSGGSSSGVSSSSGSSSRGGSSSGSGSSSGGSSSGGATGVPCDVATLFAGHCTSCHSNPPQNGSLSSLITYADLMATSKEDATKNEAQLSLSRMQNAQSPMPPANVNDPATAAMITTLQNWINGGYPMGSCGDGGMPPPPPGVFQGQPPYQTHNPGQGSHNAGRDCLSCHNGQGDPNQMTFGGTVYDGNNNPLGGVEVRLVDANNNGISVYSDVNGNFHSFGQAFAAPGHVGARDAQNTNNMVATLTYGGCNSCHCSGNGCSTTPIHLP